MDVSKAETSMAEMSEEIIYTSVRFSQTPPVCANDVVTNRAPHHGSSGLYSLAVGVGTLIALMVIAVVVWRIDSSCPGCPDEWFGYRSSCYFFSEMKKDWNSSQASCSAEGSHLLVINDANKMVKVSPVLGNAHRLPLDWSEEQHRQWLDLGRRLKTQQYKGHL
ncbi:killer cell lectin-like receptor subfamily G member 1 isoform X2 [Gopherus flavomarginatus]|uniref:killer cell lectin-like receptor subfamily G member 1 isoform X2 n=1 Tax=Gopherus flavomarginatus TaxID=286002 RepID=UPI0021CBC6F0|nr:killer cell lectin-like receptor subfamily G member 1 isoform X2 [Gopherus flavomarginatus]